MDCEKIKYKLTKEGYNEFLKKLLKKEKALADIRSYISKQESINDEENPLLTESRLTEKMLLFEINNMKNELYDIEIVELLNDDNIVDLNDILNLELIYSEDDKEEMVVRLIGTTPDIDNDKKISDVSINSPIGKAIYRRKVGETVSYSIEKNTYSLRILSKVKQEKQKIKKK